MTAALALLPFAVAAAVLGVRAETPLLSYDDVYRALFAHQWAQAPYFFTERLVWLPFPLMLTGALIRVTGEVFWTALAVDLGASAVAIVYVARLTAARFGRLAAWVAAASFGLTPWVVFLALSRYGEPVLLAAVAIAAHHWMRLSGTGVAKAGARGADGGRRRDVAIASLSLTAAVLTRYEAWPLGAAFALHAGWLAWRADPGGAPAPRGWALAWAGLPSLAMAVWIAKNLAVYGRPVYGGAFGFLPSSAPAGAWGGVWLCARYLWELSPVVAALGLAGVALAWRRARVLCALIALGAVVPWYTVSLFSVEVALQVRLMLLPLMLLAPFAGAAVGAVARSRRAGAVLGLALVGVQLVLVLRLDYPRAPLPMMRLARRLETAGVLGLFDEVIVQSATPTGYPDEVRVASNGRRPVRVAGADPASLPWSELRGRTALVLNDGARPGGSDTPPFAVARVDAATAWAICPPGDDRVEWLDARAPASARPGARIAVRVSVRNAGPRAWRSSGCRPAVRLRWLREGDARALDETWMPLAPAVAAGAATALEIVTRTPTDAGRYTIELETTPIDAATGRATVHRLSLQVASPR